MKSIFKNLPGAAVILVCVAGFAAAQVSSQPTPAPTPLPPTTATIVRTINYAPVGLAGGETLQVNLANLATASMSGTAASCVATVTFYGSTGAAIGTGTSLTITSGQVVSAKLPYASAGAAGGRAVIRSVVQLSSPSITAPCSLSTSMETYDAATGITHTFQSAPTEVVQPFVVFGRN